MTQIHINKNKTIEINKKGNKFLINGNEKEYELVKKSESSYVIISSKKIFNVEVLSLEGKEAAISIDNKVSNVKISDHIDQLLERTGMNDSPTSQVKEIKAPMPGSILKVIAKENDEVKPGDSLLVLEAMKMENVIKSPGEGSIGKVHISEGENVEKNQVLITLN